MGTGTSTTDGCLSHFGSDGQPLPTTLRRSRYLSETLVRLFYGNVHHGASGEIDRCNVYLPRYVLGNTTQLQASLFWRAKTPGITQEGGEGGGGAPREAED